MVWPHPRDMILYARSSYFYNNMFIIYLFLTLFWFYKWFWSLIQKNCGNVCHYAWSCHIHVILYEVTSSCFPSLVPCLKFTLRNVATKAGNVSLVLKDSDMDSENLSSLIWLSVSDDQKTDNSKVVSFIGTVYNKDYLHHGSK